MRLRRRSIELAVALLAVFIATHAPSEARGSTSESYRVKSNAAQSRVSVQPSARPALRATAVSAISIDAPASMDGIEGSFVSGRLTRTLLDEPRVPAGYHDLRIDGLDGWGRKLASGIYFYWIETSFGSTRGRFALLK